MASPQKRREGETDIDTQRRPCEDGGRLSYVPISQGTPGLLAGASSKERDQVTLPQNFKRESTLLIS